MSLGVLNNLPAVYAENNLNNSNSSLTTVLQQLSSGSKINSGADDAAGLSLVDGLQANQTALTQSVTNAKEGVGLLQVADGALSQVTSLLNRAVTLAAEASNGTLNSSQDTAANQEYQSILSEISNIGSTTTYNGEQVFNSNTNIYTGDASMAGSSIDALNIRSLSSSNVGDTGGVMAYSNGQNNVFINLNNVFINLSTSGRNAQATDTLNAASGTTTIDVNYLVKGANGAESTATTSISVGTGTSFANTANGLISAINSAGLGLTASFTTQAEAGISGGGTQTGIQITGGLVSAGVDPGAASTSGTLNPAGITAQELTLGQTVTVKVGGVTAAAVTIGSSTSTLTGLMNAINANAGGAAGLVTASIVTNGNGSQSLALADTAGGGALTVTTASNPLGPNSLTNGTNSINPVTLSFNGSAYTTGATGSNAAATLGFSGTNSASNVLSGSIVLSNNATAGASPVTFVMGTGAASGSSAGTLTGGSTFTVNGNTLGNLATAVQAELGVTATVGAAGITMTSTTGGTTLEAVPGAGNNTLTTVANVNNVVNVAGTGTTNPTQGTMTIALNGDGGTLAAGDALTAGTSLVLTNGNVGTPGSPVTFVIGASSQATNTGSVASGTVTLGNNGTLHVSDLVTALGTTYAAALGLASASAASGNLVLTALNNGTTLALGSGTNLADTAEGIGEFGGANSATGAIAGGAGTAGTAKLLTGLTSSGSDTFSGTLALTNSANGTVQTFVMGGTAGNSNGTITVGGTGSTSTLTNLMNAINIDSVLGITATMDSTAGNGGIDLSTTTGNNGSITVNTFAGANKFADNYSLGLAGGVTTVTEADNAQYNTAVLAPISGANSIQTSGQAGVNGGALTGTIVLTNHALTDTFVMGGVNNLAGGAAGGNTFNGGTTLATLMAAINGNATDALDLTASEDAVTGGLVIQSTVNVTTGGAMSVGTNTLSDAVSMTTSHPVAGAAATNAASASVTVGQDTVGNTAGGGTINANDTLVSGTSLVLHVGATDKTFTMGTGNNTANQFFTGTGNLKVSDLINTIDNNAVNGLGLQASIAPGNGGLTVSYTSTSNQAGLTLTSSTLEDSYQVNAATGTGGAMGASATGDSATVGTTGTIGASDTIGGSIVLTNGGAAQTFVMGTGAGDIGGTALNDLKSAINNNTALGIVATVANGALHLQSSATNTSITVNSSLTDTTGEALSGVSAGSAASASTTTLTLGSGSISTNDVLTGGITLSANGNTVTFNMNSTAVSDATHVNIAGNTLSALEYAINHSSLNVAASQSGANLTLTSNVNNATTIGVSGNTLNDAFGNPASVASLGTFASANDVVSGTMSFQVGSNPAQSFAVTAGETVQGLVNQINHGNYGVSAALTSSGGDLYGTSTSDGFVSLTLTSNTYGANGVIQNTTGTHVTDTTP
ncbi:MAG: flagellin, partial [Terracidiphilus sp.]